MVNRPEYNWLVTTQPGSLRLEVPGPVWQPLGERTLLLPPCAKIVAVPLLEGACLSVHELAIRLHKHQCLHDLILRDISVDGFGQRDVGTTMLGTATGYGDQFGPTQPDRVILQICRRHFVLCQPRGNALWRLAEAGRGDDGAHRSSAGVLRALQA